MKGIVTAADNYSRTGKIEHKCTVYWDREIRFFKAIKAFSFGFDHDFGRASDEVAIHFCQQFIDDFDPENMIAVFEEEKGGYGFMETYCSVYLIKKEEGDRK